MNKLLECALGFEKLLNIQYKIIIGRKGQTKEICLGFSEWDFHHLIGLGKLKDLRIARKNRKDVFYEILSEKISYQTISKSRYISLIENRFRHLINLEKILDENRLIFHYNSKSEPFSLIEADYLLSTPHKDNEIYIFLAQDKKSGDFFCRSFFPKEQKDYTKNQAIWTMLYKEKIYLSTGNTEVQFDHLSSKS